MQKLQQVLFIFRILGPFHFFRFVMSQFFSYNQYYVLGRSLLSPLHYPDIKKTPETLSLISPEDWESLKNVLPTLDADSRREILARIFFFSSGLHNCFCIKQGADIAYLQWLIYPSENGVIRSQYSNKMYPLSEKQVMVENAFTMPRFRGRGYLPCATNHLLELAKKQGFTNAVCYIRTDRIVSVNEFLKMGFKITKIVSEFKICGMVRRTL